MLRNAIKSHQILMALYRNLIFKQKWKKFWLSKIAITFLLIFSQGCWNSLLFLPTCLTPTTKLKANGTFWVSLTGLLVEFMTIMTLALTIGKSMWRGSCVQEWNITEAIRWVTICHSSSQFFSIEGKVFNLWVLPIVYIEVS